MRYLRLVTCAGTGVVGVGEELNDLVRQFSALYVHTLTFISHVAPSC
jgi:hypothetical protein